MEIKGSCHCKKVTFQVQTQHPYPYQRCYCSICRKTAGGGGYLINLSADANSLEVVGENYVKSYQALLDVNGKKVRSLHHRYFCMECGSHLWAHHENWPDLVHPVAGAIDTDLPKPPSYVHMMLSSKASWVEVESRPQDQHFDEYPQESIKDWHEKRGLALD